MSQFFAHSTRNPDQSDWQRLSDHLTGTGRLAQAAAEHFGAGALGNAAGLLHDLGKYTREFQMRLTGEFPRMDHSTWGARIACERYGPLGQLLAYGIAGHHAGLANGNVGALRRALQERLNNPPEYELLSDWEGQISLPVCDGMGLPMKLRKERVQFQQSFLGRMLFSCLVDADFIDTDEFYRRVEGLPPRDCGVEPPRLEQLRDRLDSHLTGFSADTHVNRLRASILAHVRGNAELEPGLFSLTVPTGGGKTLASLAFALDHAIRHGLRRVIYVIPFTSIVEQNAAVFRNALGELGDAAVLEHHSAFIDDGNASEAKDKLHLAMENWDAPIVVTTAVQFFESLFADRPSRCRKLHNITESVVILDEAQTLPLKLLRPCVTALDELALNYRTSIVLCTATQPALNADDGFHDGLKGVRELAPDPPNLYRRLKRVQVRHAGQLDDVVLTDHLRRREQVLCIVNNRRHARALFEAIAEQPGARHLTTLMCAKHRSKVLAEVRHRLQAGEPCRLVSTSLIEAGVDVDFPAVLRAEAGLDSIAQAAGRCNREGRRTSAASEVLVFATANDDWAPPPELKQFAQVFREIQRGHREDLLALEAVRKYFQHLYWQKGAQELDAHDLLGLLRDSRLDSLPFETLAAKFRIIESAMLPVIVPYDEQARRALRDLESDKPVGAIARQLQPYLVQLPRQGYDALYRAHAIQPVAQKRLGDQFMELVNPDLYDCRFGLHWDDPVFIRVERLII